MKVKYGAKTRECDIVFELPKHKLQPIGLFAVDNKLYDVYRDVDDGRCLAIDYYRESVTSLYRR